MDLCWHRVQSHGIFGLTPGCLETSVKAADDCISLVRRLTLLGLPMHSQNSTHLYAGKLLCYKNVLLQTFHDFDWFYSINYLGKKFCNFGAILIHI